jgi:anti-anti-sigma factor
MIFRTKEQEGFTVLIFEMPNLLNGLDIDTVENALGSLLDTGTTRFLLDFQRLKHISSQALSMLLRIHLRVQKLDGGELILCGVSPQLLDAIHIMRLDRLIPIFPTRRDALRARRKPKSGT